MTRTEVLVVLGVLAVLISLLYPAVIAARRAARKTQRRNNLKQIGLAFLNFHDSYKRLPPAVRTDEAGRPLCSWRFQITPFLEAMMFGFDYDAAWDDPANRILVNSPWGCYCLRRDRDGPERLNTNVVAIIGPGTPFGGDWTGGLDDLDPDTILAIEIANFDAHWMEPGDLHIDDVPASITQGIDGQGVHVLFADGEVWYLDADVPLADLKKFFTVEGAKKHDREQVLGPYFDGPD
jgi:hypothetical protein